MKLFKKTIDLKLASHSYAGLVDLISKAEQLGRCVRNVNLDLMEMDFIWPYQIVMIACIIEELKRKGIECLVIENPGTSKYINDIKFNRYWKPGFNRDSFTQVANQTTFCLWHISNSMIDQYAHYAKSYYTQNFFKRKDLDVLSINLSELFNNINDHSGSKIQGYVITEYYRKRSTLIIAVCDFGVGIPKKVNQYLKSIGKPQLSDKDAINLAFKHGFSTKSALHNRGFGLANIEASVKSMKGKIMLLSNEAAYFKSYQNKIEEKMFPLDTPMNGTLIAITLDTNHLEDLEEEVDDILGF